VQTSAKSRTTIFDLASEKIDSSRLGKCGEGGAEGGLSGLYQGSVDRYKIATLEKHREKQLQGIATRLGLMKSIFIC